MTQPILFPNEIDKPDRVLMWSIDEIIPVVMIFGVGIVMQKLLYAIVAIIFFQKFYRRFQEGSSDGYMYHFLWWKGIDQTSSNNLRNPYQTTYHP